MRQRLIGAAVLVPVVVIFFLLGAPWLTLDLLCSRVSRRTRSPSSFGAPGLPSSLWMPVIGAPLIVLGLAWVVGPERFATAWTIVAPVLRWSFSRQLYSRSGKTILPMASRRGSAPHSATLYPALLAFAAAFVGLSSTQRRRALPWLSFDHGQAAASCSCCTVWTLDSGAYIAGKYHRAATSSPTSRRTRPGRGAIGGAIAAIVVATLLFAAMGRSPIGGPLLGLVIAIFAQAGDLAESMLKRAAGAKDSGTLIPGHGGFLDRVDSFLFAAPAMYALLTIVTLLKTGGFL